MPSKLCDVNEAAVLIKSMVCELIDPLSVGKSDRGAHTHTNARTHARTQTHRGTSMEGVLISQGNCFN